MIQTTPCPDAARWEALLADPGPADADLESHLAGCPACRGVLDDLAVGSSGWLRDAGRLAASTADDPDLTRTLDRLRDAVLTDDPNPPVRLDFMTPSDTPGVLGTLGRYQVLAVIGRGAFGVVLKALDPDLLRPVAVKVLAPHLAPNGTARQRFLREARAAAAVSHDHVVTIHAVEPAELPYLVMEYVTGLSLQARLDRDGPLPPRDIARIGMQAAGGLAAAHAVGLIHRDVKPANILLENGVERVKLTDFGLARAADDARLTQSGMSAGTPLYMSPEQARGDHVDARSDLFSLGSVLYTLATGFPPFRAGTTMGVLNRITNDPPRPIRETNPDFPPALERTIMQLLEKNPARRPQTAAEVSGALADFLAAPPERARPRRGWLVAGALAAVAILLVAGVVLTFKTAKGTLVVEIDDPAVKVAIDGEELTITGAGPHEVRLKPGTYQLAATKDGQPVPMSQDVVTITRNSQQVVRVSINGPAALVPSPKAGPGAATTAGTIKPVGKTGPAPGLTKDVTFAVPAVKANRLLARLAKLPDTPAGLRDLMADAWQELDSKALVVRLPKDGLVVQTHASFPRLQRLLDEAAQADIGPDRLQTILTEAYLLAKTIQADTDKAINAPWDEKLRPLLDRARRFREQLPPTPLGRAIALRTGPADDAKALSGLSAADAERAKKVFTLQDQFDVAVPKVQDAIVRLGRAKQRLSANIQKQRSWLPAREVDKARDEVNTLEAPLYTQLELMAGILSDLEKIAAELGAKPAPPPTAADGPDERLKKATAEYTALVDRLAKTEVGRVLVTVSPGADTTKLLQTMTTEDGVRAKKLLVLRDRYDRLVPQARKDLDRWEKAGLDLANTEKLFKQGVISDAELELKKLEHRQADRAVQAGLDELANIVRDLRVLADELKAPPAEAPKKGRGQ